MENNNQMRHIRTSNVLCPKIKRIHLSVLTTNYIYLGHEGIKKKNNTVPLNQVRLVTKHVHYSLESLYNNVYVTIILHVYKSRRASRDNISGTISYQLFYFISYQQFF